MSGLTRPRGPLPSRVYWTRRVLLLVLVFATVAGIATLVGPHVPGGDEPVSATPVGATPTQSETPPTRAVPELVQPPPKNAKRALPQPTGPCPDDDVVVTPVVREARRYTPTAVVLRVTTEQTPACTWEVSPESVFVTVTPLKGFDSVWSSQECTDAVPTQTVVARQDKPGKALMTWLPRMSDETCSDASPWIALGRYRVAAVARGATEPQETTFRMRVADRAAPSPEQSAAPSGSPAASPTGSPAASGSPQATGSAEASGTGSPETSASASAQPSDASSPKPDRSRSPKPQSTRSR